MRFVIVWQNFSLAIIFYQNYDNTNSSKLHRTDLMLQLKRIINKIEMQPQKPSNKFIKDSFSVKFCI